HPGVLPAGLHQRLSHRLGRHPRPAAGCQPPPLQLRAAPAHGGGLREPRMSLISVEDALQRLLAWAEQTPTDDPEAVPPAQADARVLAAPLLAGLDLPPRDKSAMDGYALRLADGQGGPLSVSQRILAGGAPQPLQPGTCARIFPGAPLPPGADCVEMQENT